MHSRGLEISVVLPTYQGKGDPMECGSYTGIKLLEHAMKVVVSAVKSMYTGAKTVVRTVYGNSKGFEVKVVQH